MRILLRQGYLLENAVKQVGMVVEGINALPAAIALSKNEVEMSIINDHIDPKIVIHDLMDGECKSELLKSVFAILY